MKLRFVIQEHFTEPHHYDWMFEVEGEKSERNLMTWSVEEMPQKVSGIQQIPAKRLENHRSIYLEYEGEVSSGRGYVKIYDKGYYEIISSENDSYKLLLNGKKINGTFIWRGSSNPNHIAFFCEGE